jgi:hypothetical protein
MSRILLIDVDSVIPNLVLMQISAYHKQRGDQVSLDVPNDPNKVYISCIFKENRKIALGIAKMYPGSEIVFGGSGINYEWLPDDIKDLMPDYDIYNNMVCQHCGKQTHKCKCVKGPVPGSMFYSMGFTSRGCIRACEFCIVHDKEGPWRPWHDPERFHDPRHKKIIYLDNNIYADKEHFFKVTDYVLEHKLRWNAIQGMDIRLIDPEIAARLKELKWYGIMRFAFDNMEDEPDVRKGMEILKAAGIDTRNVVEFFVLVGFNTTPEQDKYRCRLLKSLEANPFVMQYTKNTWTKMIARWANRRNVFWSCDIDEYTRRKDGKL